MDNIIGFTAAIVLVLLLLILIISNIVIVQQSRAYVIERLGAFRTVWGVGLHLKIPFIERIAKTVSLKEQVVDFAPQPVITKDNVTMQIDTVIYFQITDPKLYAYGVEHPMNAIENLTATTLRNIIGDLELDQSLTSRDHINTKMRAILDEATDDVTQRGGGQVLNGTHGVLNTVGKELGVGDLVVHNGVDLHGDVILGDNGLGRIVQHLLLQGNAAGDAVNEGDFEMQAHTPNGLERAQTLDDVSPGLLDHSDILGDDDDHDDHQYGCDDNAGSIHR